MDAKFPKQAKSYDLHIQVAVMVAVLCGIWTVHGQDQQCVSADRVKALTVDISSKTDPQPDEKLKNEILKLKSDEMKASLSLKKDRDGEKSQALKRSITDRMCSILNSTSWPVKSKVGPEATSVWMNLVRTHFSFGFQRVLVPIISAGVDKDEIDKDFELAALIDRLRLAAGGPQLFGTQAAAQNGFLVLWPLQSEDKVDAFRADYHMGSLRDQIRAMQEAYKMPLIRSTAKAARIDVPNSEVPPASTDRLLDPGSDENVVTKVETSLVTIDAVVYGPSTTKLEKNDFKVYENGEEQEIHVFGAAESPSDIVLLLDLSGSTSDKLGLIRKTTKQFIEMKRDVDRVSVITFAGEQSVVSPLEADKAKLLDRVGKLKDSGESRVWDAINFAIEMLRHESPSDRRKAVVVMTDGVDNSLAFEPGFGSNILFSELLETVRNNSIAVFPIYLDTEGSGSDAVNKRVYADARRTLQLLADDSGGVYYAAKDISNLSEVYERVLKDLGRVYSLGYEPKNSTRDGSWRTIRVEIPGHPEIKVRARSGYYAK
jgi:VWFA-related protein